MLHQVPMINYSSVVTLATSTSPNTPKVTKRDFVTLRNIPSPSIDEQKQFSGLNYVTLQHKDDSNLLKPCNESISTKYYRIKSQSSSIDSCIPYACPDSKSSSNPPPYSCLSSTDYLPSYESLHSTMPQSINSNSSEPIGYIRLTTHRHQYTTSSKNLPSFLSPKKINTSIHIHFVFNSFYDTFTFEDTLRQLFIDISSDLSGMHILSTEEVKVYLYMNESNLTTRLTMKKLELGTRLDSGEIENGMMVYRVDEKDMEKLI
ncbi:hypothetical protein BKA69DRAFT_1046048 [Paraphysoderma sedebokerense]|nr:hypothetical protein BKA69DRAFT_1046048 [Paraphysoderma sedebokerense]